MVNIFSQTCHSSLLAGNKMALLTLPFLYLNLGGEMLYILNQRLTAQKSHVSEEKKYRVMRDIVEHMLRESAIDRLFIPKPLASAQQLRADFTKLAHSSIMKLNEDAMEKLFDLMQMAVKYQVMLCKSGDELLLVTLNHLDGLRRMVGSSDKHIALVNQTCIKLTQTMDKMNAAQFMMLRHMLLGYFQGHHKKVSIFLSTGIQRSDGRFFLPTGGPVPQHCEQPGTIRYSNGRIEQFTHPYQFTPPQRAPSLNVVGDRVITLGLDMYSTPSSVSESSSESSTGNNTKSETSSGGNGDRADPGAKAELDLLQHLLIGFQSHPTQGTFKLSLFDDEYSQNDAQTSGTGALADINTIRIDSSKSTGEGELGKILSEFGGDKSKDATSTTSSGDDLLSLMDAL